MEIESPKQINEVARQTMTIRPVKTFSLVPENLEQAMKLSELMANSDMVPKDFKGKPGNVLVAVQMGAELGLPPAQALQNIAVINGRPSLWGDGALAVVQSHPLFVSVTETYDADADAAVCVIVRRGEEPHRVAFSRLDAQDAGLLGKQGPWKQYPKRMMQMRARSFAMRDKFADALKGVSIAEEARDIPPVDMGEAVVVEEANPDYPQEKWDTNFPRWERMVREDGKNPANIVSTISSSYTLTREQVEMIMSLTSASSDVSGDQKEKPLDH